MLEETKKVQKNRFSAYYFRFTLVTFRSIGYFESTRRRILVFVYDVYHYKQSSFSVRVITYVWNAQKNSNFELLLFYSLILQTNVTQILISIS
jgi:hypothetical protein